MAAEEREWKTCLVFGALLVDRVSFHCVREFLVRCKGLKHRSRGPFMRIEATLPPSC